MVKMSGGEALAKSLVREGVEVVFGIPGIQMYGIIAALRGEPGIRMITPRHEQAATYMADGYARASGKPGVALVVPGVGLYNAASGIATAYARSSPVLVIAGQIPRASIGRNLGAVHEIADQPGTVRSVTKWQHLALTPKDIPYAVSEAFRQMRSGRSRPVLVEIPPEARVEQDDVQLRNPAPVSRIVPSPEQLQEAARVIAQSSLPLIYAGGGVARSDAEQALVELAEATNIPVVTSSGGKGTSAVRLLCPHALQGETPKDIHGLRIPIQPRLCVSDGAGREGGEAEPPSAMYGRRRRVHVQLVRAFHGGQVRDQRNDRSLQKRLVWKRCPRPKRLLHWILRDRSSQPGLRKVCRIIWCGGHESRRSHGSSNSYSARAGPPGASDHRRTFGGDADTTRTPDCASLCSTLDAAAGRVDWVISRIFLRPASNGDPLTLRWFM